MEYSDNGIESQASSDSYTCCRLNDSDSVTENDRNRSDSDSTRNVREHDESECSIIHTKRNPNSDDAPNQMSCHDSKRVPQNDNFETDTSGVAGNTNMTTTELSRRSSSPYSSVSYGSESLVINVSDESNPDDVVHADDLDLTDGTGNQSLRTYSQRRESFRGLSPMSFSDPYSLDNGNPFSPYCPSSNLHFHPAYANRKSVCVTYFLVLFLGLVGGHHFYLNRPRFGTMYVFTAGLLGIGYIVDLVRVPWLVENANMEILHPELKGKRYIGDAYLLWVPPFGLLGFHHFYLKNPILGVLYMFSGGGLLLGWLMDLVLVTAHWTPNVNDQYHAREQYTTPDVFNPHQDSLDRSVMTSPDVHITSIDDWGYSSDFVSQLPSYSEVDELGPDPYSPPPYCETLTLGYSMMPSESLHAPSTYV